LKQVGSLLTEIEGRDCHMPSAGPSITCMGTAYCQALNELDKAEEIMT